MRHFKLVYNGKTYEFDAEETGVAGNGVTSASEPAPLVETASDPTPISAPISHAGEGRPVNSPLSGKVLEIYVAVGDEVSEGDVLLVMDAMKMEIEVQAEESGRIASINVSKGELINMNQIIMTIN